VGGLADGVRDEGAPIVDDHRKYERRRWESDEKLNRAVSLEERGEVAEDR
jgi:hypothetical protein